MWLTCCALHNLLLHVDGLDDNWEDGVPSCWEDINNKYDERVRNNDTPFAISKLNSYAIPEQVHLSEADNAIAATVNISCSNFKKYTVNG